MTRKLPPLSAVKAFEAAARHGSFSRAAKELNVTSAAVSQHIKGLENWLGEPLFLRRANGVSLTERGTVLVGNVSRLLDDMAELLAPKPTAKDAIRVTLAMPPYLADGWLLPKLSDFETQNPGIAVAVHAIKGPVNLDRKTDVDFAIDSNEKSQTGLLSDFLFEESIQPVCTPQYRDLLGLQDPHNWKRVTLLHDALCEGDWSRWANQNATLSLDWHSGLRYPNQWLAIEAAKQARGIFIARRLPVAKELAQGTLVSLSHMPMEIGSPYSLIRRRGHGNPATVQLRAWLLTNMRLN